MKIELSHLLEEPDIHAVYIERYRAEYAAKQFWRVAQRAASWTRIPKGDEMLFSRGGSSGGRPSEPTTLAGMMLLVKVPGELALNLDGHYLRFFGSDVAAVMRHLSVNEMHAWEDYLNSRRNSAVFQVVRKYAMVRPAAGVDRALVTAVLKIAAVGEAVSHTH